MDNLFEEVAVVILNFNGAKHLETFLPSVTQFSSGARVIVADNGSTDDSLSVLANFPSVEAIKLDDNYGFCGGYNRALEQIQANYYVLLNSDVEVTEGWLEPLLKHMELHKNVAACQPKIKAYHQKESLEYAGAAGGFIDSLGYPFNRGRLFDTIEEDNGQYNDELSIFWATGASMFVRAEVYHALGGLDSDFFAHMEEIDLCWRIKRAGYSIKYIGNSTVYHVGGGTLHKTNPRKTYLNFRNSLFVLLKNLPANQVFIKVFARLCLDGIAGVRFVLNGDFANCWAIIRAHFGFYKMLPKMLRKRQRLPKDKQTVQEIYSGSIVVDYFFRGIRKFSELNFIK